jgi:hypothetical protein
VSLTSPWTLLTTAAVSAPAWWGALGRHDLTLTTAASRTLIVLVACSFAVGAVERLIDAYAAGQGTPARRADDGAGQDAGRDGGGRTTPADPYR